MRLSLMRSCSPRRASFRLEPLVLCSQADASVRTVGRPATGECRGELCQRNDVENGRLDRMRPVLWRRGANARHGVVDPRSTAAAPGVGVSIISLTYRACSFRLDHADQRRRIRDRRDPGGLQRNGRQPWHGRHRTIRLPGLDDLHDATEKARRVSMRVYDSIPTSGTGTDVSNYEQTSYGYENYGLSGKMARQNRIVYTRRHDHRATCSTPAATRSKNGSARRTMAPVARAETFNWKMR